MEVKNSRSGSMMSQIRHIGGRVFQRILSKSGIDAFSGPQGKILDVLWQKDDIPAKEIAEKTGLARNTLTSMLDNMEHSGLVMRTPGKLDRRTVLIRLTDKARLLQKQYEDVSLQMTQVYFRGFSDEEIQTFEALLTRILENVKEEDRND